MTRKIPTGFILAAVLFLGAGNVMAGELYTPLTSRDSGYTISNDTINITSYTVSTVTAGGPYRTVCIGDPSLTVPIYYRMDGTNTSISTSGWWIPAGQGACMETKGVIYFQLGAGAATVTARKLEIKK